VCLPNFMRWLPICLCCDATLFLSSTSFLELFDRTRVEIIEQMIVPTNIAFKNVFMFYVLPLFELRCIFPHCGMNFSYNERIMSNVVTFNTLTIEIDNAS